MVTRNATQIDKCNGKPGRILKKNSGLNACPAQIYLSAAAVDQRLVEQRLLAVTQNAEKELKKSQLALRSSSCWSPRKANLPPIGLAGTGVWINLDFRARRRRVTILCVFE